MKAIVQTRYGTFEDLEYREVEMPEPGEDEVLVKVYAASVNAANLFAVSGKPFISRFWTGLRQPNYLNPGSDVAGRVEAVGRRVETFKPGDAVLGDNEQNRFGTYAEYVCVPEDALVLKPANITFEEAAAVPQAALVALQALRNQGQIEPGQKVLITGASGGNGTFAVQIAKALGAEVTGVCSTRNVEMVRALGADHVVDYTQDDFAASGKAYDLIIAMGGYRPPADYARALRTGGTFVWAGGDLKGLFETMLFGPWISRRTQTKLTSFTQKQNQEDLQFVADLMAAGKVKPVIDHCFRLKEAGQALRHYQAGHLQGKVVISVGHDHQQAQTLRNL